MSEPLTRFVVGAREGGTRLDVYLHRRIPGLSRSRIQQAIRSRVRLSWEARARPATPVRAGGEIHVGWTPVVETIRDVPLPLLAFGEGWLAVDKPPGIVVHPVNRIRENSLIRMLRRQQGEESLRLVHRLDRETSGALLVADRSASARRLSGAFMRGDVHKEYLAIVRGVPQADAGTVDLPVGDAEASAIYTKREAGHGQPALTRWRVERRGAGRALMRLFPATGRRHQLRVHLEAIGHPVLGDVMYGRPEGDYLAMIAGADDPRGAAGEPARQLLHCARIVVPAGDGAPEIDVAAPLPADFDL